MAVRMGEMMVVIRAQDFASRTLHKVSGELNGMQRQQLISARAGLANAQAMNQSTMAIRGMRAEVGKLEAQRLHRIGSAMSGIGRTTQLWGAVGTAAFGVMANSAAKFSASASTAATQMRDLGGATDQIIARSDKLQKRIIELSMVFPATADDMTTAAYDIFSSMNLMHNGVMDVEGGLKLLAIANKAAVAGQTDLKEATNAMVVALNTFDPNLQNVQGTMDTVFNTVRFGKLRLDDLSRAFTSFSAVAKASGLSLKSVGGAFATLSLFMTSDRAGAGLGRLIEIFRNPVFTQGFKNMGIDVEKANGQLRPLVDIMRDIAKLRPDLTSGQTSALQFFIQVSKASGMTKAGIQGTVQARRAFEQLVTHMSTFNEITGEVARNKNELDKAFRARMADPGVQWEIFKNQLRALVIVIGQEALPIFIKIGRKIQNAVAWFRNLSKGTRGSVITFAVWASVGALLGGILLSLGGSLAQVASYFKLMRNNAILASIATGQATTSVSLFKTALIGLTKVIGFGALFILIQQMYGFKEAVIATSVAWVIWRTRAIQSIAIVVSTAIAGAATIGEAFTMALAGTGWGLIAVAAGAAAIAVMNHWDEVRAYFAAWRADVGAGFHHFWDEQAQAAKVTIGGILVNLSKIAPVGGDAMEQTGKNLQKSGLDALAAMTDPFTKNYNKFLKKFRAQHKKSPLDMDWMKRVNALSKGLTSQQFRKAWNDWANTIGGNTKKAAEQAKAHAQAIKTATDNMNESIKEAAGNLANTYDQLRQQNEAAMHGLFQGPTMTGVLGSVFSDINDTLRQFGIQIPVPFAILKQDMDQSVTYFKRWRSDIAKLLKRGMPIEMVEQIQALGPDAGIPIAEGLLQGGKAGWKSLVKEWKSGQKLIDQATKQDMDNKLKLWNSYGKDAAWATIMGIINNPRNYKITKTYETYVKNTYGSILKKVFQDDVAEYMKNALAQAQAAATLAGLSMPPGGPGGTTPAKQLTFAQKLNKQLAINQQKLKTVSGPIYTDAQRAYRQKLLNRRNFLEYEKRALPSVRAEMAFQRKHGVGADGKFNIVYMGDEINIKADGATVESVTRALTKKHFRQKNKHKKPARTHP